jgi:hypothetical protein
MVLDWKKSNTNVSAEHADLQTLNKLVSPVQISYEQSLSKTSLFQLVLEEDSTNSRK